MKYYIEQIQRQKQIQVINYIKWMLPTQKNCHEYKHKVTQTNWISFLFLNCISQWWLVVTFGLRCGLKLFCWFCNMYFSDWVKHISPFFYKVYFLMMTGGNLWFEVRFEIGMLGRGSDIGGREYWGLGGKQAWRGLKLPPHEMSCHVRSDFPVIESHK